MIQDTNRFKYIDTISVIVDFYDKTIRCAG